MAQQQIDLSGTGGLHKKTGIPNYRKNEKNNIVYLANENSIVSGVYNPRRYDGFMAPAIRTSIPLPFGIGSSLVPSDENSRFVVADGTGISADKPSRFITYGSSVIRSPLNSNEVSVLSSQITTGKISDMILYQADGGKKLFRYFIWNKQVHRQDESEFNQNIVPNYWQSLIADNLTNTNELVSDNATFVDGKNDLLYVLDKNRLHTIISSSAVQPYGIFSADTLTFGEGFNMIDGIEYKGKVYITYTEENAAEENSPANYFESVKAGVFVWNKRSISDSGKEATHIKDVAYVNEIFSDGFELYLITTSISGSVQVRTFDGNGFPISFEISSAGGSLTRERVSSKFSVTTTEQGTFFITSYGDIYLLSLGGKNLYKVNHVEMTTPLPYSGFSTEEMESSVGLPIDVAVKQGTDSHAVALFNGNVTISEDGYQTFSTVVLPGGEYRAITHDVSNDTFAIVGTDVSLISSDGGATWSSSPIGTGAWSDISYGNGVLVAVGLGGKISVSPDGGTSWVSHDIASTKNFTAIAYSSELTMFSAGTDLGQIYTSPDGVTWTDRIPLAQRYINAIEKIDGLFYVLLYNELDTKTELKTTSDFSTYTDVSEIDNEEYVDIAYGNDIIIINDGTKDIQYSTDNGATWTSKDILHNVNRMRFCNTMFFAVGDGGKISTSPDGNVWTARTTSVTDDLRDVVWTGTAYVAVGYANEYCITSPDGSSWTDAAINLSNTANLTGIAHGNGITTVSDSTITNALKFKFSTNGGLNWTQAYSSISSGKAELFTDRNLSGITGVSVKNGNIVTFRQDRVNLDIDTIISKDKKIYYKSRNIATDDLQQPNAVPSFANGTYFTPDQSLRVYTSTDLDSWSSKIIEGDHWWLNSKVVFGNGYYAAVPHCRTASSVGGVANRSRNAHIMYNQNPVIDNWKHATFDTVTANNDVAKNDFNDIAFGNGRFVGVAPQGVFYCVNPSTVPGSNKISTNNYSYIEFGNGVFMAVSHNSTNSAISSDGATWTSKTAPFNVGCISFDTSNNQFVISENGGNRIAYSSDGTTWITKTIPFSFVINKFGVDAGYVVVKTNSPNQTITLTDTIAFCYDIYESSPRWRRPVNPQALSFDNVVYSSKETRFVFTAYHQFANEIDLISLPATVDGFNSYNYDVMTVGGGLQRNLSQVKNLVSDVFLSMGKNNPNVIRVDSLNERATTSFNLSVAMGKIIDIAYLNNADKWIAIQDAEKRMLTSPDGETWTSLSNSVVNAYPPTSVNYIDEKDVTILPSNGLVNYTVSGDSFKYFYPAAVPKTYGKSYYDILSNRIILFSTDNVYRLDGPKEIQPEKDVLNKNKDIVIYYGGSGIYASETDNNADIVPAINVAYEVTDKNVDNGLRFARIPLNHIGEISVNGSGVTLYPKTGNVLTAVRLLPKLSNIENLTVYCVPTLNEDPVKENDIIAWIDIYVNSKTEPIQTKVVTRKLAQKGYVDIELNQKNINSIQVGIRWNEEHATGENDFMPGQSLFTYKPVYSGR